MTPPPATSSSSPERRDTLLDQTQAPQSDAALPASSALVLQAGSNSAIPAPSFKVGPNEAKAASSTSPNPSAPRTGRLRRLRSTISKCWIAINSWWWCELVSIIFSLASIATMIALLASFDSTSLTSWHSRISPNTMIAILSTASKTSLMLAVAACISQMKWELFRGGPQPLNLLDVYDEASRGPLGSTILLFDCVHTLKHRGARRSTSMALLGAVVTIAALALDPFSQQILSFPTRSVSRQDPGAIFNRSDIYDASSWRGSFVRLSGGVPTLGAVDATMQNAIMIGLYGQTMSPGFSCLSGNCTWPAFHTLGVCRRCEDVTTRSPIIIEADPIDTSPFNYTTPGGFTLQFFDNSTEFATKIASNCSWEADRNASIARFAILKSEDGLPFSVGITECSLRYCLRRFDKPEVRNALPDLSMSSEYDLEFAGNVTIGATEYYRYAPSPSLDLSWWPADHIFHLNWLDRAAAIGFIDTQFNVRDTNPCAIALLNSPDIPRTIQIMVDNMSYIMMSGVNSTTITGETETLDVYIHVTWPWAVLPIVVVVLALTLVVLAILETSGQGERLWKSLNVPLLLADMADKNDVGDRWRTPAELDDAAKGVLRSFEDDRCTKLSFGKAATSLAI